MFSLPSTSDFPPDPVVLRRPELDRAYLQCRNGYKCLLISRGQHRSLAGKARDETAPLRQRLLELAAREESVRKDIYEMPKIVTALAGDIEDAGDGLVDEFGRYHYGRNSYQECSPFGGLIRAGGGLELASRSLTKALRLAEPAKVLGPLVDVRQHGSPKGFQVAGVEAALACQCPRPRWIPDDAAAS